jgi:LPS-assembly protein
MISSRKRCALLPLGATLLSALAQAADPLCLPAAKPLRMAAAPTPLPDTVQLDWSTAQSVLDGKSPANVCGNAQIKWADRSIDGDCFNYDPLKNSLRVVGHFRYQDPAIRFEADNGNYDDAGASATGAKFQLLQQPGRGAAEAVRQTSSGEVELSKVSYTTCPADQADWQLIARRITLNPDTQRGVGLGTKVVFKGVPVLYVPWMSFPLSDQRQSGFLYPTFGTSSRSGATLSLPYYLNLAPSRDLTLTPTIYTQRGLKLGSEFRFLQTHGHGVLQVDAMPRDSLASSQRNYQRINTEWQLPGAWRVHIDAENVSDTHYFEDFAQGPLASSTAFLARRAELSYRDDVWQAAAELLQFQTLDNSLTRDKRPFALLPRLTARGRIDLAHDWRATVDSEAAGFERDVGVAGWRAVVTPTLSWQRVRPGYFFRPSLGWDFTSYRLRRQAANTSATRRRTLPMLNVDFGLQLEKRLKSTRRLTLEPRLLYTYIPLRDQTTLPVFDAGLPDPNFVSLYRTNRYVGADRISDANRLAFGLTSRMVDSVSGRQYLSATFGQSYEFTLPRVTLPGETPSDQRRSNLIGNVELSPYKYYSLRADLAWNPQLSKADRAQLSVQYRRAGNQLVNVGYRFDRGSVNQADISAAWPLGRHWDGYARAVYSFRDPGNVSVREPHTIDSFAGIRYRGNCWGLRAVVRRALSSRTGEKDTGIYLQLELNGLSSVGTGADAFLQESIQGYTANDPRR